LNKLPAMELRIVFGLSFVAGLVDVLGFSSIGGHFLSFMSGNSTFLALAIGRGDIMLAAGLMALIGLFFIGVMMGMGVGEFDRARASSLKPLVLLIVSLILFGSGFLALFGFPEAAIGMAVIAMGMMNTALSRKDGVVFGLTYLTGAVVQSALHTYLKLKGDHEASAWPFMAQWSALIMGGIIGVFLHHSQGLIGFFTAGLLVFGFALMGFREARSA
jgi:uncharacterized membrane protein YoaK (UPF0700 family)